MLLAGVVETSRRVADTSKRLEKIGLLAGLIQQLNPAEIEIVVTLTGIDETFVQPIHARYSFVAEDLRWNMRFVDILGWTKDGRRAVDFRRFDEVVPIDR